jgi:hypothetical protein
MATYYAWSNFPVERNEWGQTTKVIEVGEEVTAAKLGVSKEEFDEYIELGTVSEEEYPDVPDSVSPAEYEQSQTNQQVVVDELQAQIDQQKEAVKAQAVAEREDAAATPAPKSGGGAANK